MNWYEFENEQKRYQAGTYCLHRNNMCCLRHPYFILFTIGNTVKCHVWKIYEKLFDMCNSVSCFVRAVSWRLFHLVGELNEFIVSLSL